MCSFGSPAGAPTAVPSAPASPRSRRYASTSFFVTRPRRPLPSICDRSSSCSSAIRRTTGVTGGARPSPPPSAGAGRSLISASPEAASPASASSESPPAARPSPPVSIVASTVPTSTVSPTGTSTSLSRPLTGAGTSVSTLSVEISTIGSSASTSSPGSFFQATMVPSATETPIWGMVTSAIPALVLEELTAGLLDVVHLRQHRALERRTERNRHVGGGDPHDRPVEVLERLLRDQSGDLRGHAAGACRLLHQHDLAGLPHAREHRVTVIGVERPQVEHLDRGPVEVLGRFERRQHHGPVGDEREVLALAGHAGLSERRLVAAFRNLAAHPPVQMLVLHVDDRVRVADSGRDQALGVVRRGRGDHLEAGGLEEPRLRVLRVEGSAREATARG